MRSISFLIVAGYVLVGVTWIFLSDKVSYLFSPDTCSLYGFELIKGTMYVVLTGALLFLLVRNNEKKLETALARQEKANADLRLLLSENDTAAAAGSRGRRVRAPRSS